MMPAMSAKSMQVSMRFLEEIRPEIEPLSEQFSVDMRAAQEAGESQQ